MFSGTVLNALQVFKVLFFKFWFTEITHRLQTARPTVRQLLFRYLLPWLCNMELVDPNLPPMSVGGGGFSYPAYDLGRVAAGVDAGNLPDDLAGAGKILIYYQ